MEQEHDVTAKVIELMKRSLGDLFDSLPFPPPVFTTMNCEFIAVDFENQSLTTRCPIDERYLNPYRTLQGGIIAAAVDNTLGPLSVILAPPNVTRILEMKYSHPVAPEFEYIEVKARLVDRDGQWLHFSAEVRSPEGKLLARAKAAHFIISE